MRGTIDTVNDDQPIPAQLTTWVLPAQPADERTPLTVFQLERLHADLHPARVASRQGGGGKSLSYLEAYDVRATLIRIFGYGNFSLECTKTHIVHETMFQNDNGRDTWRIAATATMRLTIHQTGAVYTETAASAQTGADYGEVLDFALKTAQSDALKRCATNLGTTFGLSLYNSGSTQDVVGRVFAPDQMDVVEDMRTARTGGDEGAAARARMQARLKQHTPADPAVRAQANADTAREQTPTERIAAHDVIPETAPTPDTSTPVKAPTRPSRAIKAVS